MNYLKSFLSLSSLLVVLTLFFASCSDDEEPTVEMPRAIFEFDVASDNSGTVNFTSLSLNAVTYAWDFGDGSGMSTEVNPSYTYASTGKYTVTLTVTNEGGTNTTTLDVSVVFNLVQGADMANEAAWTFRNVWEDNVVNHGFVDGAFVWDNSEGFAFSQAYLWQEIALEADKKYRFNADIKSTSGTSDIWFEVYFGNADPASEDDYGSNGLRLYVSSFDSPDSGCANDPFDGDILSLSQNCIPDPSNTKIISSDGSFTLTADELTSNGTIYLVFKSGCWDNMDNYKDGISLDNIVLEEVL